MLKILIATSYLPWPISEGGRVAQLRVLQSLQDDCEFTIIYPLNWVGAEDFVEILGKQVRNIKLVPVECFERDFEPINLPWKIRLRRSLVALMRRVFPAPKVANTAQFSKGAEVPWYIFQTVHQRFVDELARHVDSGNYDLVQVEFTDLMSLGVLLKGRLPSIFVHHQLHFIYEQRCLECGTSDSGFSRYLRARMRLEEKEYLQCFDRVITFSETDKTLLRDFCLDARVESSPFPAPEPPCEECRENSGDEKSFCILASEGNPPNVQGLDRFMREVWPALKKCLPNLKIQIVGKWSEQSKMKIHCAAELEFLGFVPDLTVFLQDKIMIVPIWIGSGIRTKILAAWAAACPVITTSVGVEGLPGRSGEDYFVADSAEDFVNCCRELVENHEKRNKIAKNGWSIAKEHFSLEAVRQKRLSIYNELIGK